MFPKEFCFLLVVGQVWIFYAINTWEERAKNAGISTPKRLVYHDEILQLKSTPGRKGAPREDTLCFNMEILCSQCYGVHIGSSRCFLPFLAWEINTNEYVL